MYGGAILSYEPLTMTADSLTSNTATGPYESYGGALYSDDSTTSITNTTMSGNVATSSYEGYGGAIYDDDGFTMGGSVISGNVASHRGGGLMDYDGTETISNVSFTGNKVTGGGYEDGGGAIYNDDDMYLNGSTVSGNSATVNGTYAARRYLHGRLLGDDGQHRFGQRRCWAARRPEAAAAACSTTTPPRCSTARSPGNTSSVDGGGFLKSPMTHI